MASPRCPTTMKNLPDEVLSVIFIRLMAKQLARIRCVCKSWNALLSGSSFVKFHLHHLIHTNNEILLFFGTIPPFNCGLFTARPSCSPDLELTNFMKIPFNTQSNDTNYGNAIGSVNGLICFSYGPYYNYSLHIWNPSLSAMLTLPPCFEPSVNTIRIHFRFGYDPKTDDYKVVKLTFLQPPFNNVLQAEVYSMKKGSWELITQRFPSHIIWICDRDEVCVDGHDGHLHWLCCTTYKSYTPWGRKPQTIVAFNLGAETFLEIPLPASVLNHTCCNSLGVLGGKLCVMSSVEGGKCEVWVMDEYGVPESWVKHRVFAQCHDITPYGFTLQNEFLYKVDNHFALYDPVKAKIKRFKIMDTNNRIRITKVVEYVKSLVWVAPART